MTVVDTVPPVGVLDRTPPQDIEAEGSVLGAMMIREAAIADVQDELDPGDFYRPAHESIYAAIVGIAARGQRVDPITVADELRRTGDLARVGGAPYLHELTAMVPTAANASHYARIVRQVATRRRLIEAGTRIVQLGYATDGAEIDDIVEVARAEVDGVPHSRAEVAVLGERIDSTIDLIEAGPLPAFPTPWSDLNNLIRGWQPGRLYVIGARPSVGKSILLLQAAHALAEHGWVSFHTLEMPEQEVHTRLIAAQAHVSLTRLEAGSVTDHDWQRIADASDRIRSPRLAIDDRSSISVPDVRAYARTLARRGPLAGICVDYLQLMSAARGDRRSRQEQVAEWSRQLKILAKEMQVPVIVASQLNRNPEGRTDKRPGMADLRESGAVEQDSDVVLLLHVDDDPRDASADPDLMHVLVAKNRQGPKGAVRLTKVGEQARLDPWSPFGDGIHPVPRLLARPAARDWTNTDREEE